MKKALVIFAKAPVAGQVKTRLVPPLTHAQAAELQKCFLRDTFDLVEKTKGCDLLIAYAPPDGLVSLKPLVKSSKFKFHPQRGGSLGERMHNAFREAFRSGYGRVVIIGTDPPTLPLSYLNRAFKLLESRDIVIGPNADGGYYLIGMRNIGKDAPHYKLFSGISWSTEKVLRQTVEKINKSRVTLGCLDVWYDVDMPASLRFFKSHLEYLRTCRAGVPKRTYKFLKRLNL